MSNLRPLSDCRKPTRALLSIRPEFATAILSGNKGFEFRRSVFTRPVKTVLLYVTVPVHQVVAEFDVRSVITEPVNTLWNETSCLAGIDEQTFFKYFDGKEFGHAIEIGELRPYTTPFCPVEVLGIRPPQSFAYLDSNQDTPATATGEAIEKALDAIKNLICNCSRQSREAEAR